MRQRRAWIRMNVALFGGTGRTGQCLLRLAVTRGVPVRALIRPESSLGPDLPSTVTPVVGSLFSDEDVGRTLAGCDAACLVFGPRPPHTDVFCAEATARIVEGMRSRGIPRIVCQTGAMVGSYPANRTWVCETATRLYRRRSPEPAMDRVRQETVVADSGLDWTLVKPPRLTDGPRSFRVAAGPAVRVGLLSSIARDDVADVLLSALMGSRFSRSAVFVRRSRGSVYAPLVQRAPALPIEGLPKLAEEGRALGMTEAAAR